MVQRLGLHAPAAGSTGLIPGGEPRCYGMCGTDKKQKQKKVVSISCAKYYRRVKQNESKENPWICHMGIMVILASAVLGA